MRLCAAARSDAATHQPHSASTCNQEPTSRQRTPLSTSSWIWQCIIHPSLTTAQLHSPPSHARRRIRQLEQFTDSKGLEVQTAPIAQALANNATGLCELLRTQALAPPRTDKPYWSPSWFYIVAATLHEGEHTGLAFLSTLLCMPDQLSALSALYPALHAAFPKLFGYGG